MNGWKTPLGQIFTHTDKTRVLQWCAELSQELNKCCQRKRIQRETENPLTISPINRNSTKCCKSKQFSRFPPIRGFSQHFPTALRLPHRSNRFSRWPKVSSIEVQRNCFCCVLLAVVFLLLVNSNR